MADYQNRVSQSFSDRMRLNRFRRKRERSSFREEFRIIPRWLVVTGVLLWVVAIALGTMVNLGQTLVIHTSPSHSADVHNPIWPPEFGDDPAVASLLLALTITAVAIPLAGFLLLLGYVYRDAKRRGMHAGLWLLLILILSPAYLAIGFLLYFFLREPLPYACPQCATIVGARFNFCPNCNTNLHPSCPNCRQEVSEADKFCANCGNTLSRGTSTAPATPGGELQPAQQ
jgi:hypothetical protein